MVAQTDAQTVQVQLTESGQTCSVPVAKTYLQNKDETVQGAEVSSSAGTYTCSEKRAVAELHQAAHRFRPRLTCIGNSDTMVQSRQGRCASACRI